MRLRFNKEKNMWHDHDKIIEIYNKLSQGDARFPCECPNCRHKTTHIYIHAHNRDHCGIWIWCSECGAYAHMSGHTPTWWENPIFVDSYNLCSEPDYLETKTTEIDDSRPTVIKTFSQEPTFISVLSGKINTVYDLDEFLK